MFQLPKNEPVKMEKTENLKIILFGEPMTGKSTFATGFPNPIVISTEGNLVHDAEGNVKPHVLLDYYKDPSKTIAQNHANGWLKFKSMLPALIMDEEYETIIIDLLSDLYNLCRFWYLDMHNIGDESEFTGRGNAWVDISREFMGTMKPLLSHPSKNVILITHVKEFTNQDTGEVSIGPDMRKAVFNDLCKSATANMYLSAVKADQGIVRILHPYSPQLSSMNRWGIYEPIEASYDNLITGIKAAHEKEGN